MLNKNEEKLESKKSVINKDFSITEKTPILSLVCKEGQDHAALYLETFEESVYSIKRMDLVCYIDKETNPDNKASIRFDEFKFLSKARLQKECEKRRETIIKELERAEKECKQKNQVFQEANLLKALRDNQFDPEELIDSHELYEGVCESSHCITWEITSGKADKLEASFREDLTHSGDPRTSPNTDITYTTLGDTSVRKAVAKFFASPIKFLSSNSASSPTSIDQYFNNEKKYDNCLSWALKKAQLLDLTAKEETAYTSSVLQPKVVIQGKNQGKTKEPVVSGSSSSLFSSTSSSSSTATAQPDKKKESFSSLG